MDDKQKTRMFQKLPEDFDWNQGDEGRAVQGGGEVRHLRKSDEESTRRVFKSPEDDNYSPRNFYCSGSDGHGHWSNLGQVRVPSHYSGLIESILEMYPQYKYRMDFVRDAIVHRIVWCYEQAGVKDDKLQQLLAVAKFESDMETRARGLLELKTLEESLEAYLRDEHDYGLRQLRVVAQNTLESETPHYTKTDMRRFGEIVRRIDLYFALHKGD